MVAILQALHLHGTIGGRVGRPTEQTESVRVSTSYPDMTHYDTEVQNAAVDLDVGSLVRERPSEPAPRLLDLRGLERPRVIAQFFNGHLILRRGGSDFNDLAWVNMLLQYCETILAARCSWRLARCLLGIEGAPGNWHTRGLWPGPVLAYAWCSAGRSRARQPQTISSSLTLFCGLCNNHGSSIPMHHPG